MIRILAAWIALVAGVAFATPAFAHAALLSNDPTDGAVLSAAPKTIVLSFNEPVTPVEFQAIDVAAKAHPLTDVHLEGNDLVGLVPDGVGTGTLTVSWRVISADSHPVGGSFLFSIGAPTATAASVPEPEDAAVEAAVWSSGLVFLGAILFGIGGTFFLAWMAPAARRSAVAAPISVTLAVGLVVGPLTIGLQGVDALGDGLAALFTGEVWRSGLLTTYGATFVVAEVALAGALAAMLLPARGLATGVSGLALLGVGVALSLSGHASDAPPRELTWVAVLLHGVAAAFWVGSIVPLGMLLRRRDAVARTALRRFSAAIPFALVPLVAAGLLLALVQLTRLSDLWTTAYGAVLSAKLLAVIAMLGLAAVNRYWLAAKVDAGDRPATAAMATSIRAEWVLALLVVALVAGFRLTPPPRSVFAATEATAPLYTMGASADAANMANINLTPGRVGLNDILVQVTDRQMAPMTVEGVTVSISDSDAGIQPITRAATRSSDSIWRVDGITLPVAGRWTISVAALLSEFRQVDLTAEVAIVR